MYFMGYYIKQESCCSLFPTGREDCFYINKSQDSNFRKLRLNEWAKMCKIFVEEWNQRSK